MLELPEKVGCEKEMGVRRGKGEEKEYQPS